MIPLQKPTSREGARELVIKHVMLALHAEGFKQTHALLSSLFDQANEMEKVWLLWAMADVHHRRGHSPKWMQRTSKALYCIDRFGYPDCTTTFYDAMHKLVPEWFLDAESWCAVTQEDWADLGHELDRMFVGPRSVAPCIAALRR